MYLSNMWTDYVKLCKDRWTLTPNLMTNQIVVRLIRDL